MKIKYFFVLIFSMGLSIDLFGQNNNNCENIFLTAVSLSNSGKYDIAIKKIAAYKLCCSPKESQKADSLLLQIYETVNKQKGEAIVARRSADSSATVATEQKNIAIKQKEANQTLLARNYWSNAQRERSESNLGLALLYTAEGISISKDKTLTETMLIETEAFLPKYFLKNIKKIDNHAPFAVFSPDGKLELTITERKTDDYIQLWNTTTSKKLSPPIEFDADVLPFFTPDGRKVLSVSDGYIGILNTETGKLVEKNDAATEGENVVLSPDEKWILTSGGLSAIICDGATGLQIGREMRHSEDITSVNFSPDGKRVLTSSRDRTALIWNAENGMQIGPAMRHKDEVLNAHFSPDGKQILTACLDGTAHLWDAANCVQIGPDMKHNGAVMNALYNPDGKMILTLCVDSTVRLWDAGSNKQIGSSMKQKGVIMSADFSPDGKLLLITTDDNTVNLWDIASGKQISPGMKHDGVILKAFFISGKKTVLTAGLDSTARFWDETSSKKISSDINDIHSKPFFASEVPNKDSVLVSPDGKRIVSIESGVVRIKNAANGKQIGRDIKYEQDIKNISRSDISEDIGDGIYAVFSPDGKRVLTVPAGDKIARIWDAANGNQTGIDIVHKMQINSFVFSADGKRILTASNDKAACIWDAATGKQVGPALQHKSAVTSAFFSPDGKRILTAGYDGTAHLWDLISGKQIGPDMKQEQKNNNAGISDGPVEISAVFSPDGKTVITTSKDKNTVHFWNMNADLDIPVDLFKLQIKVALGVELNVETGKAQVIPPGRWHMLKKEYDKKAKEHYKMCKYRECNYWGSCYSG